MKNLPIVIFSIIFLQNCGVANHNSNRVLNENTRAANVQATLTPTQMTSPPSETAPQVDLAENKEAVEVIRQYYDAINKAEYRKAYAFWAGEGEASKQTFEQFRKGFLLTAPYTKINISDESPNIEGAAGSRYVTIPLTIESETIYGKKQKFAGEYVLKRVVVDGATAEQKAWHIYSADIKSVESKK